MSRFIRIHVLVENTARKQGLLGEHGLSFWIQTPDQSLLFDTGQGLTLAHNAERLGIDLSGASAIVLSHGHFDHTGGLPHALALSPQSRLFLHPRALTPRFSIHNGQSRSIGLSSLSPQELQLHQKRIAWTTHPTEVIPGVFATGEIPRLVDYEDTGGPFFLDPLGQNPDSLLDDQALYMDTDKGVVVILGCAHAGIINTLNYIKTIIPKPLHAVIGGTHLLNASDQRLNRTLDALDEMNLHIIAPAHCTGPKATAAIWTRFPNQSADCCAGAHWSFKQP